MDESNTKIPDMCADCEYWKIDSTREDDICASYWDYCIHPNAPEDSEIIDALKPPADWCPLKIGE